MAFPVTQSDSDVNGIMSPLWGNTEFQGMLLSGWDGRDVAAHLTLCIPGISIPLM